MFKLRGNQAVLLTALAWVVAQIIGGSITRIGESPAYFWQSFGQALSWLVAGLLVGAALYGTNHTIKWHQVLLLGVGWAVGGLLDRYSGVFVGGVVTVLVLRRTSPSLHIVQSLIILLGWFAAGLLPLLGMTLSPIDLMNSPGAWIVSGLIVGAVGGGVMFWQLGRINWGKEVSRVNTWTVRDMVEVLEDSPLMDRLIRKRIDRQRFIISGAAFCLGLIALMVSTSLWGRIRGYFMLQSAMVSLLIYLVTLAPAARAPLIVSSIAALMTASDANKQQFQLLRMTPISEREVTWAYSVAPLRLLRGLLTFEYLVMLLMLAGATCTFLPSFPTVDGEMVLVAIGGVLMLAVGLIGMNVLAAAVGVRVALWWREPSLAAVVAPLGMLMIILLMLLAAVNGLQMLASAPTIEGGVAFLLLMIAPYVAAMELMDHTQPWKEVPGGMT